MVQVRPVLRESDWSRRDELRTGTVGVELGRWIVGLADHCGDSRFTQPAVETQVGRAQPLLEDAHVDTQHVGGALDAPPRATNCCRRLLHVEGDGDRRAMRGRSERRLGEQRLVLSVGPVVAVRGVVLVPLGDLRARVGNR